MNWRIEQGAIASAQTVIAPNGDTYFHCGERDHAGQPILYKNHNMSGPTKDVIPPDVLAQLQANYDSMMALPIGERDAEVKRRRTKEEA